MRQAGRSLPEYRALRGEGTILDAIAKPELAAEITLQPVRRYGVDAAILYSDIVVPISAIGFGVDIAPGIGPVVDHPFASAADLDRIRPLEPEVDTAYVLETIRILVGELDVPLIGFAGAPFTVASYLVEGRPSRTYTRTKALMHGDPPLWHALMERLADLAIASLRSQIEAGARRRPALRQLGGRPEPGRLRRSSWPPTPPASSTPWPTWTSPASTSASTPASCWARWPRSGADVVGRRLARARSTRPAAGSGPGRAVQGNLDPALCFAPWPVVEPRGPAGAGRGRPPPRRSRLQPGPRRHARHRPRGAGADRRAGPRRRRAGGRRTGSRHRP